MSQIKENLEPRWYVVHTYSGYENKVKTDLEKTIKNRELEDYFFDIVVPMEEQIEIKDGKQKEKTGEDRYKIWDIQDLSACGCSLRSAFSAGSLRLQWRQCGEEGS